MGNNTTPDRMRGLIVPTSNLSKKNLWTAQSSFTEMNPRAGVAKATQPYTGLVLEMAGTQSETIQVETVQGGIPGGGSAFKWSGEDSVNLSQNANNVITDWKYLAYTSLPSQYQDFDAIGTSDGSIYFVTEVIVSSQYSISVKKQSRDGSILNLKTFLTVTLPSSPAETAKPAITELKDGSLLVCYFAYTGTNEVNLVVWRSYDSGTTWKEISSRALEVPLTVGSTNFSIECTNLVMSDDYVVLTMSTFSNQSNTFGNAHRQYVSRDQGSTFQIVGSGGQTYHMVSTVSLPQGRLGTAYISDTDTIKYTRIPNPGVNFGNVQYQNEKEVTVFSGGGKVFCTKVTNQLSGGSLTSWYQDGVVYIAVLDTSGILYGFQSTDQGDNWEYVSQGNTPGVDESIMYSPASTQALDRLKSTVWEGRAVVLCQTNNSVGCMYWGGWSTVDFPELVPQPGRNQYHGYFHNWFHNQLPSNSTAYNSTGVGSDTIIQDGVQVSTNSNIKYYSYQNNVYTDMFYQFRMKVTSGTSVTQDYIVFNVVNTDGAGSYTLKMRFNTTSFTIRDHSTSLASVSVDLTDFFEFMVFQNAVDVVVYYRPWDEKQAKKWTGVSVTLGSQAPGATALMEWGHKTLISQNYVSVWSQFNVSSGGAGKPGEIIRGGMYPTFGEYIYVNEGLLLTAKESPARAGDVYKIDTRADFPVDNIFHQVALSPRMVWRSKNDTLVQSLAWYVDPVVQATERSLGLSDVMGFHLSGINWKTANLETWNGSSWDTIKTINTSEGLEGQFKRVGATLAPNSSSRQFSLHHDEGRGWYAQLQNGDNKYMVKIKQNTEGIWTTSLAKSPVLLIDTDHTDPSTLPTSGDISIIPTSVSLVAELFQGGVTLGNFAFRLSIPAQDTLEGYFQIGTMVQGSVYFMAPQYQRGRSITHSPNVETVTTLDNMFYSRKLSEGSRTFQVAWTEPVDTRTIMSLDPDYWQFSSSANSVPVANYGDAPFSMLGMCRYLANRTPVVYLPSMKKSTGSNDIQVFNRYHDHSLVRPEGEVTMESVLGDEGVDEMFRLANITLIEVE